METQINPFLAGFTLVVLVITGSALWLSLMLIFQHRATTESRIQSILVILLMIFGILITASSLYTTFYRYFTGQLTMGEFSNHFLQALPTLALWNLMLPMCRLVFEALIGANVKRWQAISLSGLIAVSMASLAIYWILSL